MKLNIGENIKRLRREKDMTQEEFAELLGVSCQSVSRWENGTCYPDMELLPTISDFFQITVDKLLGISASVEEIHVAEYLERYQSAVSQGRIYDGIEIARKGIAEYPNNYSLLNKLMESLFISGDNDGNIPEWKENMKKYDMEITALGERIMAYCPDQAIRLEATWRLAFNHCQMGRKEIGRQIFEKLPNTDFCRENAMWWCLEKDERLPYARNQVKIGYDFIASGISLIISAKLLPDEELLVLCEKRTRLDELIYDGKNAIEDWGAARFHCEYAAVLSRLGRKGEALKELERAEKCAEEFDSRPVESTVASLLMGETIAHKVDFVTGDSHSLAEILRKKWLLSSDFDNIRNHSEFVEIAGGAKS